MVDRFAICQAYAQLESDYNVGGWLRELPSNQRRRESIGCQLARIGYSSLFEWVDVISSYDPDTDDYFDEEVREIYFRAVLRWNLPIDAEMMVRIKKFFVPEFLAQYPQTAGAEYLQG